MLFTLSDMIVAFGAKPTASEISVKTLLSLSKKARHLNQPEMLGGSAESLESYYNMIRQFAAIALKFRHLIPADVDSDSISTLADYLLNMEIKDFKKIANNLPSLLDGSVLSEISTVYAEADIDPSWGSTVDALSTVLPEKIDLTEYHQDELIAAAATELTISFPSLDALCNLDRWLTSHPANFKNSLLLASKIAVSKMIMNKLSKPLHVSLVVAMYNEHNRIRPKSIGNPNGEDFLRRKMKQLTWVFDQSPVSFEMILVDDGCPNHSGPIAEKIVQSEGFSNARILYIEDGIKRRSPVLRGLYSSEESRKGGSIHYGMWRAIKDNPLMDSLHIVVYTDADMAAFVNQIGLLLMLQDEQTMVSVGSRYDIGSVCRGPWGRDGEIRGLTKFDRRLVGLRGVMFSKLFPQTGKITDTQCGFKAYNAEILREILIKTEERTFSFDIELMVLAAATGKLIAHAPIYWHDSLAESNFWINRN